MRRAEEALLAYGEAIADERLLMDRIDTLSERSRAVTTRITGMPASHGDGSLLPELMDERVRLKKQIAKSQKAKAIALRLLEELPPKERRLLTAYYIQGKTWAEAAAYAPCAPRTAAAMKERALNALEERLKAMLK